MRKSLGLLALALVSALLPLSGSVAATAKVYADPAQVQINELACDNSAGQFVELVNTNAKLPAQVGGWQLSDQAPAVAAADHRVRLAAGKVIPAAGRLLLSSASSTLPFDLSCGGDVVYLAKTLGASWQLIDEVSVPNLTAAASWGRDSTGVFRPQTPTPGAANAAIAGDVDYDRAGWLFDPEREVRIDLTIPEASEQALVAQPSVYTTAAFRLTDDAANLWPDTGAIEVGVRLKGGYGSFLPYGADSKSGFKIKFGEYVPGQRFFGLKKLTLNNMRQDPSMLHETFTYSLFRTYGLEAPRTGFANLYVNGQLRGFYLLLEPYDDVSVDWWVPALRHVYDAHWTLQAPFSKPEIDSWLPETHFQVDEGDENDYSDLEQMADAIAPSGAMGAEAAKRIDFNQVGRFLAIEKYVSHWDGYSGTPEWTPNNYNLASDRTGKFTLLPWGTDQTWGYNVAKEPFASAQGLLFNRCLATSECRSAYYATLQSLPSTVQALGYADKVQALFDLHSDSRQADTVRQSTEGESEAELGNFLQFIDERPADVFDFLQGRQLSNTVWQPAHAVLPYGARLTAADLNAFSDQAGGFVYSKQIGDALPLGKTTVTATLRPASPSVPEKTIKFVFTVKKAQSIAAVNPGTRKLKSKSLKLSAKVTSGLAVTWTSASAKVCTVKGTTVTLKAKGVCLVKASQSGNSSFFAAPVAGVSFSVS